MLIYEKNDGHIYYNAEDRATESDQRVTFKDKNGTVIQPSRNDTYVDDGAHGMIRLSDNKFIAMFAGNVNVIPGDWSPEEKAFKSVQVKKASKPEKSKEEEPKQDEEA